MPPLMPGCAIWLNRQWRCSRDVVHIREAMGFISGLTGSSA